MGSVASKVHECGADWDYICILFNMLLSDDVFAGGADSELEQAINHHSSVFKQAAH